MPPSCFELYSKRVGTCEIPADRLRASKTNLNTTVKRLKSLLQSTHIWRLLPPKFLASLVLRHRTLIKTPIDTLPSLRALVGFLSYHWGHCWVYLWIVQSAWSQHFKQIQCKLIQGQLKICRKSDLWDHGPTLLLLSEASRWLGLLISSLSTQSLRHLHGYGMASKKKHISCHDKKAVFLKVR